MTTDQIREDFLRFFSERDHRRLRSASLIPAQFDPSVLLTTAGMHPLKPYFLGQETPPHHRLTSCQKVFRTSDIENVGNTARHLTFFEMLGNFSIGDYFKQGAVEYAVELSTEVFGFRQEDIWATVFVGDEELGLGNDVEAIEAWRSVGFPDERIVQLPRSENFWQAGPTGPCGPCAELYLDRGPDFGPDDERPGDDGERFLEYWNLVFMQFNQDPVNTLTPLPAQNIDTGLGLNRMAVIQQGVPTIFETDQFRPLMQLGRELAGKDPDERALRILADHTRGMTFLLADGVVPSNEDRGYILRRLMRRAIQQGHRIGIEPGFLPQFAEQVIEVMGPAYPELVEERGTIERWVTTEEASFGRTLEQGLKLLEDQLAAGTLDERAAFQLHDTFGFPFEMTREIAVERGVDLDEARFDLFMDEQRARSRAAGPGGGGDNLDARERAVAFARRTGFETDFVGYETVEQVTTVGAVEADDGRFLLKLTESPFYAAGGGQIADTGTIACESGDCRARVAEVLRVGDDQAVVVELEQGELTAGERVVATVDRTARHATEANHTATHLLHAALRERLGTHVHQAGSYVGPDKLRFDFSHTSGLSEEELRAVEDRVNDQVLANLAVRALTMPLDEAKRLGAMALFGEKYGDVVRMVQIGDGSFSRELCGGTHVRSTAEIGVVKIVTETSSAANVRRIEALTGPEAVALLRREDALLREAAGLLRKKPEEVPAAVADLQAKAKEQRTAAPAGAEVDIAELAGRAVTVGDVPVLTEQVSVADPKALLGVHDKLKGALGDAVIVLGAGTNGRVALLASVAPSIVERGVKAGEIVKQAAQITGGGGGGRDTMAQAGGKDASKLPEALATARSAVESILSA